MDGIRNRLLGLNQKKILKPDAFPSVNLPLQDNGEDVLSRSERKRSILQETKIRLKCLTLKKACVTTAKEPFTTSKTENICSSCFETQKENALLLERICFLDNELEKTKKETEKNQRGNKRNENESVNRNCSCRKATTFDSPRWAGEENLRHLSRNSSAMQNANRTLELRIITFVAARASLQKSESSHSGQRGVTGMHSRSVHTEGNKEFRLSRKQKLSATPE
ncbi:hypothetical protein AVEN_263200-1 [Araneus ventricosus]|uniref:Uncharacterized protein n=1 Tax=Araneus ventricosus TaxID=182803 RepID=A0A4Y2UNJ4_ARAVE|nr:hypothetical protein AVEN_263200-1 [Araneus ventricosus]